MHDRFYRLRNIALLSAFLLLLWRYPGIDLGKIKLLEDFSGNLPQRILPLILIGSILFFVADMVLSIDDHKEERHGKVKKQVWLVVAFSGLVVLLSLDKVFSEFGMLGANRWAMSSSAILAVLLALATTLLHFSCEVLFEFMKYRKCIRLFIVFPILLSLCAAMCSILGLLFVVHLAGQDKAIFSIIVFMVIAVLAYFVFRPSGRLFPTYIQTKLKKLSDALDRRVELSDYAAAMGIISNEKKTRGHRNVMKQIRLIEKENRSNTSIEFRFLADCTEEKITNIYLLPDDKECIELRVTDKSSGNIEFTTLKVLYIKQAIPDMIKHVLQHKKGRQFLRKPSFLIGCFLRAKTLQHIAKENAEEMLVACAHYGTFEDLKNLVDSRKPNVNHQIQNGWNALLLAVADGDIAKARYLLQKGADPNIANKLGASPLGFASLYGNLSLCKLLLSFGAEINQADPMGITALMKAAEGGHTAVVSLLLEKGADPAPVNSDDKTALDLAIKAGYGEIAKMLRKRVLGNKKVQSTS